MFLGLYLMAFVSALFFSEEAQPIVFLLVVLFISNIFWNYFWVAKFQKNIQKHPRKDKPIVNSNLSEDFYLKVLQVDPFASFEKQVKVVLLMFAENNPEAMPVFFRYIDKQAKFIAGYNLDSKKCPQPLSGDDTVVTELLKKLDTCADLSGLQSVLLEPCVLPDSGIIVAPVNFFGPIEGILMLRTPLNINNHWFLNKALYLSTSLSFIIDNNICLQDNNNSVATRALVRKAEEMLSNICSVSSFSLSGFEISERVLRSYDCLNDFHFCFQDNSKAMVIILGSSSARGYEASIIASSLELVVKSLSLECNSPSEIIAKISLILQKGSSDYFVSMVVIKLEADAKSIVYSSAGNCIPVVNRPTSGYCELLEFEATVPAGLLEAKKYYKNEIIQLLPGDGILLYTDGLLERSEKLMTLEDLKMIIEKTPLISAEEILGELPLENDADANYVSDCTCIYIKTEQ